MSVSDVTLVVPVHGDDRLLDRLLDALDQGARALGEVEVRLRVVVSDDASPRPISVRNRAHLDVAVVRSARNVGPGGARNLALREVRTPWVVFLDADMIAGAGWLERLASIVSSSGRCADGGDGIDGIEGRVVVPGEAGRPTPFTHATEFSAEGVHHGAGNVAYRTELLRDAGGFDERFFDASRGLHFREDTELHLRLVSAGARIGYDPELVAEHPPLPASYVAPIVLARRYYFDPLLASLHPEGFRQMNEARRVGRINLRRARHDAALASVVGSVVAAAGVGMRRRSLTWAGFAMSAAGWSATAVALSWRRHVRAVHLLPLAGNAVAVPWVYVWHYYRGVLRFRHRPRL